VVNRTDQARNTVYDGVEIGGVRSLDGVIAHEMTHGSLRAHFGLLADGRYPGTLVEGYCDYVAGGGSLSDAQALNLIAHSQHHPALPYWVGRQQITMALAKPGATLDQVFASQAKF